MTLRGKNIAVFIENMYEDLEFWYPYLRMKEAEASVCIIGPKVEEYTGKNGLKVKSDQSIIGVKPQEFNALIIPGGYSPDKMRRTPEMVDFTRKMYDEGKWVAAICHGPWMLASAGILKGKKITSFFSIKDDLVNAGAEWFDQDVVKDGQLITSRNPNDLPVFCKTIIEALSS